MKADWTQFTEDTESAFAQTTIHTDIHTVLIKFALLSTFLCIKFIIKVVLNEISMFHICCVDLCYKLYSTVHFTHFPVMFCKVS